MKHLHLAKDFSLPREALLHVWSVLAVRGAGKTYMGSVLVEEILDAKMCPVIVIDPMDAWWGLKAGADGKSEGYPIIVMGGTHADVPLEPTGGALVADFFIEHRQSLILVPAQGDHRWPTAQAVRFVADFGARLYERNGGVLVFLVVDEADMFANQRPGKDELRCLGVMEHIVKRGRKPGIFPLMITQRSSNLNKNVLDETEMLVAMRTMSPRDQDALSDWFKHLPKAQQERKEKLLETWAKLPNGTAWFWCPLMDLFQQVKIRERTTFNSSATPKFGEKPVEPKVLAPVDLEVLKQRMAQTIERAKQTDPKELQREIARLRTELAKEQATTKIPVKARATITRVEVPVIKDVQIKRIEGALKKAEKMTDALRWLVDHGVRVAVDPLAAAIMWAKKSEVRGGGMPQPHVGDGRRQEPTPGKRAAAWTPGVDRSPPGLMSGHRPDNGDKPLGVGERKVLAAVAQYESVPRKQLSVLTGYKRSSRDTYLQRLMSKGLVRTNHENNIEITAEGLQASTHDPLPTGEALRDYWMARLPEGEKKVLAVLLEAYPDTVERTAIDDATGYARSSRDTYLQRLGARQLIERVGGEIRASETLFNSQHVPA